jgi:short-subunit dehydrogenase
VRVEGSRFLLTGASKGIGRAVALELAGRGARLALAARGRDELEAVATECRKAGAEAHVIVADMSKEPDVRRMVAEAHAALGGLDVLVNNAGLGLSGAMRDIKPDDLRYVFEVNVVAPLVASQEVLPAMIRQGHGRIVNVASVASHIAAPGLGGYSATKHALKAWGEALRMELRGTGVGLTAVYPGPIKTEFSANSRGKRGELVPESSVGVSAESCARSIVSALARGSAEVFIPAYWQPTVGAHTVAPQILRNLGVPAMRSATRFIDRFGRR